MKIVALFLAFFVLKNYKTPKNIGVRNDRLSSCSWTPNCVSSDATDPVFSIEPISYTSKDSLDKIQEFLQKNYKTKVIKKTPTYLYIVVTTPLFHFHDDLEFLVDPCKHKISVRSASRIGYSDLNVNRKRIEALRKYLESI